MPYLIHGGYELPLLLEGRKKLARFTDHYPPMTFMGEHRFDHWVGRAYCTARRSMTRSTRRSRRAADRPLQGHRTVYYTLIGRRMAHPGDETDLVSGGPGRRLERIFRTARRVTLFGYEDWQNDWWIKEGINRGGGFGGVSCCCAVTAAAAGLQLDRMHWLSHAAAVDRCPALTLMLYGRDDRGRSVRNVMLPVPSAPSCASTCLVATPWISAICGRALSIRSACGPDCRIQRFPARITRDRRPARRCRAERAREFTGLRSLGMNSI